MAPTAFGTSGVLGGGERYPLELARALSRRVNTELLTFGEPRGRRADGDLAITTMPAWHHLRGHPAQPIGPGLWRALADADPDIVHCHHLRSLPTRAAAIAARLRRRRIPTVVTDHGMGDDPLFAPLFDRFLAVSSYAASTLSAPPARVDVVYGGVDTDRFRPGDDQREGVLFVGRVTPHKGIDVLIRALPPGVRLTVAGSAGHDPRPPERDYPAVLARLAAGKKVTFTGPVHDAELPVLYRQARVLVLPSVNVTCYGKHIAIPELLGLAALEAMASGTPVIASRVGGLPEVVRDGESGLLVEPGDVGALGAAIARLTEDDALARSMGEAARTAVLEQFTWQACANRCLEIYEAVGAR